MFKRRIQNTKVKVKDESLATKMLVWAKSVELEEFNFLNGHWPWTWRILYCKFKAFDWKYMYSQAPQNIYLRYFFEIWESSHHVCEVGWVIVFPTTFCILHFLKIRQIESSSMLFSCNVTNFDDFGSTFIWRVGRKVTENSVSHCIVIQTMAHPTF